MTETLTYEQSVYAFNEWMRLYIEEPDNFLHTWTSIKEFQEEEESGEEPSYGKDCTRFLLKLVQERGN